MVQQLYSISVFIYSVIELACSIKVVKYQWHFMAILGSINYIWRSFGCANLAVVPILYSLTLCVIYKFYHVWWKEHGEQKPLLVVKICAAILWMNAASKGFNQQHFLAWLYTVWGSSIWFLQHHHLTFMLLFITSNA